MLINPVILNIKLNCNTYICIYSTRYRKSCSSLHPHPRGLRSWRTRAELAVQWGGENTAQIWGR